MIPPIINGYWTQSTQTTYICERSDFGAGIIYDPWNQIIESYDVTCHRDADNDVTHWSVPQHINGHLVKLMIVND